MTWVRDPNVIKAHDRAVIYIQNWWEINKKRALIGNITGDPYGIDLYNDIEGVHVNYRTDIGKWNEGPFPYNTLRELAHKIYKLRDYQETNKKTTYVTHVSTDYKTLILAKAEDFNINYKEKTLMPSETNSQKSVERWVLFCKKFEQYNLPEKNFGLNKPAKHKIKLTSYFGG